jgi:hypothetical protein
MTSAAVSSGGWTGDWLWGLPLITVSLVGHVAGLTLMGLILTRWFGQGIDRRGRRYHPVKVFMIVVGLSTWVLALLHSIEACLWAACYLALGALPDFQEAILYSLSMMTTSGGDLELKPHWQLLGRLEAVCGMLLFGLSTAFLFAVLQRVWPYLVADRHGAKR